MSKYAGCAVKYGRRFVGWLLAISMMDLWPLLVNPRKLIPELKLMVANKVMTPVSISDFTASYPY